MNTVTLVIDKSGTTIIRDGKSLVVKLPDGNSSRIPFSRIESMVVYSKANVETTVWGELATRHIPCVILPSRGKGNECWVGPGLNVKMDVRILQFRAYHSYTESLTAQKFILGKKLDATLALIDCLEYPAKIKGLSEDAAKARQEIETATHKLINNEQKISTMGIEGGADKSLYAFYVKLLPPKWGFHKRIRRPPTDPFNSLLSLCSTLVYSETLNQILLRGLDPCIGIIHATRKNRYSLALDIMEPLRPAITMYAYMLLTEKFILRDFTISSETCLLRKNARSEFYFQWHAITQEWGKLPGCNPAKDISLKQCISEIIDDLIAFWEGGFENE
ncbi:CRISPR-associated endonuclease Cas1 [Maridesulfovibrio sp.]|uniref:CRISPR-associated endonuclease Cas1 n=1 Tax=Maridesulfovibrio sp. TaxID=2795000 RepID=UPI0039EF8630